MRLEILKIPKHLFSPIMGSHQSVCSNDFDESKSENVFKIWAPIQVYIQIIWILESIPIGAIWLAELIEHNCICSWG